MVIRCQIECLCTFSTQHLISGSTRWGVFSAAPEILLCIQLIAEEASLRIYIHKTAVFRHLNPEIISEICISISKNCVNLCQNWQSSRYQQMLTRIKGLETNSPVEWRWQHILNLQPKNDEWLECELSIPVHKEYQCHSKCSA